MSLLYQADLDRQRAVEFRDLAYPLLIEADLQAKESGPDDKLLVRKHVLAQDLRSAADEPELKAEKEEERANKL